MNGDYMSPVGGIRHIVGWFERFERFALVAGSDQSLYTSIRPS
jgi:hypothetical protein